MSVSLHSLMPYYEYEENVNHIKTETIVKEEIMLSDSESLDYIKSEISIEDERKLFHRSGYSESIIKEELILSDTYVSCDEIDKENTLFQNYISDTKLDKLLNENNKISKEHQNRSSRCTRKAQKKRPRIYKCDHCTHESVCKSLLQLHIWIKHMIVDSTKNKNSETSKATNSAPFVRTFCAKCNRTCGPKDLEIECRLCKKPTVYSCKEATCTVTYPRKSSLYTHILSNHIERHSCERCGKSFVFARLRNHICRPFKSSCRYCDFTSRWASTLSSHIHEKHSDKLIHVCEACGGKFVSDQGLIRHRTIFCGKAPAYSCTDCKLSFSLKKELAKHWLSETCKKYPEEPKIPKPPKKKRRLTAYRCDSCNYVCNTKTSVRYHIWAMHMIANNTTKKQNSKKLTESKKQDNYKTKCGQRKKPTVYWCRKGNCNITYKTEASRRKHNDKHHSKRHPCEHCNYPFVTEKRLREHNCRRKNLRICRHCDYTTKTSTALLNHGRKTHPHLLNYVCEACDRKYDCLQGLQIHQRQHCGKAPAYSCTECKLSFKSKKRLLNHLLSEKCKVSSKL